MKRLLTTLLALLFTVWPFCTLGAELKATTPFLSSLTVPGYYATGKPNTPWVKQEIVKKSFGYCPRKCTFVVKTARTDKAVPLPRGRVEPAFRAWLTEQGFGGNRRIYWNIWETYPKAEANEQHLQ